MCADHGEWVSGFPFLADAKGDDGGAVTCEVVFSTGDERGGPAVAFFDFLEAGRLEALDGRVDGVVCCAFVSIV